MNCPGSVALLKALELPETDDPSYRRIGTAMHEAAEHCLKRGLDAWEIALETFNETVLDQPLCDAIQVYLDTVRATIARSTQHWVEFSISSPVHPAFYGTLDFGATVEDGDLSFVDVTDLKGGEGIIVEPDDNPQLKYYAYGLIEQHPEWTDETPVRLRIVQPRGFHMDGRVRHWWTTAGAIRAWVHEVLVPAMYAAEYDAKLLAGPWCRFCPAKLVCPALGAVFKASVLADPTRLRKVSDESVALEWTQMEAVKFYLKALQEEALRRALKGVKFPEDTIKLVQKKADRVLPEAAQKEALTLFGDEALTERKLMGPAALEKISPAAKKFVAKWAYSPNTGYTIAPAGDKKPAVTVPSSKEAFAEALAKLEGE